MTEMNDAHYTDGATGDRRARAGALADSPQVPACPSCQAVTGVRRIVWGMLPPGTIDPTRAVEGGCATLGPATPKWRCIVCGVEFGRLDDEPPAPLNSTVFVDEVTRMVDAVGGTDLRWHDGAADFFMDTLYVEVDAKPGGGRLLVSALVASSDGPDARLWAQRQPAPCSGVWEFEDDDDGGSAGVLVFERPDLGTDWAHDPLIADIERFSAAWTARRTAEPATSRHTPAGGARSIAPANAWLVTGSDASFPTDLEVDQSTRDAHVGVFTTTWTVSPQVRTGDLVLVYFIAPRKSVHFVARAASDAFFSDAMEVIAERPVSKAQHWAYLTPLVPIDPIPLSALRAASGGLVVLHGKAGKYVPPAVLGALPFVAKDPADQGLIDQIVTAPTGVAGLPRPQDTTLEQWRQIAAGALPLEQYVSDHLVEPLLRLLLAGTGLTWAPRHKVGRGAVDFAVMRADTPVCVIEVKLACTARPGGTWSRTREARQLRRYTDALGVPGILMDANLILLFAADTDEPHLEVERRTATSTQLAAVRAHLCGTPRIDDDVTLAVAASAFARRRGPAASGSHPGGSR